MSKLGEYLSHAKEIWGKNEPEVWTSTPMAYDPYLLCTTAFHEEDVRVVNPLATALEYVKEKTTATLLLFHLVRCHYCRSFYPGNLELGYECPACGAYDFAIERSVTDELVVQTTAH